MSAIYIALVKQKSHCFSRKHVERTMHGSEKIYLQYTIYVTLWDHEHTCDITLWDNEHLYDVILGTMNSPSTGRSRALTGYKK